MAVIGEDRKVTVQLPSHVAPGEHKLIVLVDGRGAERPNVATNEPSQNGDDPFRWEEGLLVYTGNMPPDLEIRRLIEEDREERMRHIMAGSGE
jgi:hypothetical protein